MEDRQEESVERYLQKIPHYIEVPPDVEAARIV
jgi:hypothetical protein